MAVVRNRIAFALLSGSLRERTSVFRETKGKELHALELSPACTAHKATSREGPDLRRSEG